MALMAIFIIGMVNHSVLVNTPAYLSDKGFDSAYITRVASGIFLVLGIAKISLGYIIDKLGIKAGVILGVGSFIISAVILSFTTSQLLIGFFVVFLGYAVATEAVLTPFFCQSVAWNGSLPKICWGF
jgi:MFS family permease